MSEAPKNGGRKLTRYQATTWVAVKRIRMANECSPWWYKGTSLIKKHQLPYEHHRATGIGVL
jgi:hypothetical protein